MNAFLNDPGDLSSRLLRDAALQTANSVLVLQRRAEQALIASKAETARSLELAEESRRTLAETLEAQKKTEVSLRESQERFQLLARATNELLWDWNLETNQQWWNAAYFDFLGLSLAEFAPSFAEWQKFVHPDDVGALLASFQAAADRGDTHWVAEFRLRNANGQYAHMLDRAFIIRDPSGRPTRVIGSALDITERKQAEGTRTRLAAIVDSAEDAILSKDLTGTIDSWNPAAERVFGYRADEMIGQSIDRLLPADRSAEEIAIIARVSRGESIKHYETIRVRKDGTHFPVSLTISPIRDQQGKVIGASKICRDISQRVDADKRKRELEQQLIQSQRLEMLGTLAGGIAHDFNNQLTGINGCIELALMDLSTSHPSHSLLLRALETGGHARSLVQRLLLFARRAPSTPRTSANLIALVRENVVLAQASAPSTIDFSLEFPPAATYAKVDAGQFQQVLLNLCTNAVHAIGSHTGRVTIGLRPVVLPDSDTTPFVTASNPGPYVCLSVSDSGSGMDGKTLARIFDPFFTTKPVGEGTGLGLAMVLGIVTEHGGTIRVRSQCGVGTTFELFWPACDRHPEMMAPRPTSFVPGAGRRILVLDDEPVVAGIATSALRKIGYAVETFTAPEEALKKFTASPASYDLVLTDAAMPGMMGFDVARTVKLIRPDIPVVIMSGDIDRFGPDALEALEAVTVLRKPFAIDQLSKAISGALQPATGPR